MPDESSSEGNREPPPSGRSAARSSRRRVLFALFGLVAAGAVAAWTVWAYRADPSSAWGQLPSSRRARAGPGFDLSKATIPRGAILSGGVAKDGIPALTDPAMIQPDEAAYLNSTDRVVGITLGDDARAYPLKILDQHEVVNDRVGDDRPVAVTYCPLCDSVAVFDRRTALGEREFGVSGLLHNSNVLMYDRRGKPESLWSQMKAQGVTGPAARTPLTTLPVELTTWGDWLARHPETKVLSDQTGYGRDYRVRPYVRYFRSPNLMFPVRPLSRRLPAKANVLGIWSDGHARAYPLSEFRGRLQTLEQVLDGRRFTLHYDPKPGSLRVVEADEGLQWVYSFWFAWYAFHPQTDVFEDRGK